MRESKTLAHKAVCVPVMLKLIVFRRDIYYYDVIITYDPYLRSDISHFAIFTILKDARQSMLLLFSKLNNYLA